MKGLFTILIFLVISANLSNAQIIGKWNNIFKSDTNVSSLFNTLFVIDSLDIITIKTDLDNAFYKLVKFDKNKLEFYLYEYDDITNQFDTGYVHLRVKKGYYLEGIYNMNNKKYIIKMETLGIQYCCSKSSHYPYYHCSQNKNDSIFLKNNCGAVSVVPVKEGNH